MSRNGENQHKYSTGKINTNILLLESFIIYVCQNLLIKAFLCAEQIYEQTVPAFQYGQILFAGQPTFFPDRLLSRPGDCKNETIRTAPSVPFKDCSTLPTISYNAPARQDQSHFSCLPEGEHINKINIFMSISGIVLHFIKQPHRRPAE